MSDNRPSATDTTMKGMALMAGCMLVLPFMDAIAKYMANVEGMSPGQVNFYRFFFQMVLHPAVPAGYPGA